MGGTLGRRWLIGGLVVAVAMIVSSWLFLIGPQRSQASGVREQTLAARSQMIPLRHDLQDLRDRTRRLPEYQAALEKARRALPSDDGMSDFLRSLQTMGEQSGVAVSGLAAGAPAAIPGTSPVVSALTLSVTVTGKLPAMMKFLDLLQLVQPRAVLVGSVGLLPAGESTDQGSLATGVTMVANLTAYVAPVETATAAGGAGATAASTAPVK